ncbi:DNA-binding response regulator [Solimonas sp. K1W22B-7]|uniref:response regulator n=1 Tax=Solimonas sp. K1W22B-7 TaxID=2303331 RepID=UPI000E33332C|nr:response regulator transcription factor [Solimonas sp. K1W22B-7]AXQ31031.1 DNA-binding response regulator [Solimonas sp. K1W22B-7]
MPGLRLIIADDHPLMRAAVLHALRDDLEGGCVFEAASFGELEAALAAAPQLDLVLLDLQMPGAQGFSSLLYLRGERPELPVLIVSASEQPRTLQRARQFGAAGFVPKSAPIGEIRGAVRRVLEGELSFPPQAAGRDAADAELAARLAQLTPQQLRVLMCMADGRLNKQIAYDLGLAENTVKVHVTAILRKLGCHGRTQAALTVRALRADSGGEGE